MNSRKSLVYKSRRCGTELLFGAHSARITADTHTYTDTQDKYRACRMLLLSVVRPTRSLEYENEMWDCQANSLLSVILGGARKILGCSSNEAVRGDMGLDTLRGHRDKVKLKW